MTVKFTNNASTSVATGINTSATSLTVASASAFPQLSGADDYCYLTIQQATGTTREVVKATALSSNTFTIVRAQDNTTAGTWSSGDIVELRLTAALLQDVIDQATVEGIKTNFQYVPTAGQTQFSGADNSGDTMIINDAELINVYMNGVRLVQGSDYTVSSANNRITLTSGATTADIIDIEVFGNFTGQSGAAVAITGGAIAGTAITTGSINNTPVGATQANTVAATTLTANSVAVDNITLDGNEIDVSSGDLTLDVAGDILLDADAGDIHFMDGGTLFGQISNLSGLYLVSNVSDAPMYLRGNNGGSYVNALTIDFQNAGAATFAGTVFIPDGSNGSPALAFSADTDTGIIRVTTNALGITAGGSRKFYVNATNAYYQNLDLVQIDAGNFLLNDSGATERSIRIQNSEATGYFGVEGSSANRFVGSSANNMFLGTTTADGIEFATNNTVRATIDSSGDAAFQGSVNILDGSTDFTISGDSNTNTYFISNGEFRIRPLGTTTNKLVIGSNGNITTAGSVNGASITSTGQIITTQESANALKTRFLMGKDSGNSNDGDLYINYATSNNVFIGAGGGDSSLTVTGAVMIGGTLHNEWHSNYIGLEIGHSGFVYSRTAGNETFVTSNSYYDSGWKFAQSGRASQLDLQSGRIRLRTSNASGSQDGTISWVSALDISADSGNATFAGTLAASDTTITASSTGAVALSLKRSGASGRAQFALQDESGNNLWRVGATGPGSTEFTFFDGSANVMTLSSAYDTVTFASHILPDANVGNDIGSPLAYWRDAYIQDVYTQDLHLSNEDREQGGNDIDGTKGNWTIQEGEENLYIINNKTGKKFKFALEEVS